MASENVVVIGAGQAAAQLAISLRSGGFAGPITVIGDEPFLPYQRPPLSKKFLAERPAPDSLYLRPAPFWTERNVDYLLGVAVAKVDLRGRTITLADGRELPIRHTGLRHRHLRAAPAAAGARSRRRVHAARDRRRPASAPGLRRRAPHRHSRRRLYRARDRGGDARRRARGRRARSRGPRAQARDRARHRRNSSTAFTASAVSKSAPMRASRRSTARGLRCCCA